MKRIDWLVIAISALGACAGCGDSGAGGGGGHASTGSSAPGGTIVFDVSGESLALGGYGFPPASADDPAFVDGWKIEFTELLVTVDKITLSENPDTNASDESQTGQRVAEVDGPWAVDLHEGGPLAGKGGGGEQAVQIAKIDNQNQNGGGPFAADTRYAFGFDIVPAAASATRVNHDANAEAYYQVMIQNGYTVLYVGTATFEGTDCTPADPEFDSFPKTIEFKLGFKSPASYVNCQNPDNDPADPLGNEEHERGIITKANQEVVAQLTIHTDHPFWESFVHDSPAHFDMLAAQHAGETGTPTVTLEDAIGVDPTAITDMHGNPVPWRSCTTFYTPPSAGQMSFDSQGVTIDPAGDPSTSIRDLYDFITYNQSTQGHLNSDGLCFVERHYASPK
jgi:hypothetical protein